MKFSKLLLALILWQAVSGWAGHLVVVTSARSDVERLSREDVINIFLGRLRQLPNGNVAAPIDLPAGTSEKAGFYRLLVNKELSEINAYWARLIFSGRTAPPQQARDVDEALDILGANPNALMYIDRSRLDRRVKVLFDLGPTP